MANSRVSNMSAGFLEHPLRWVDSNNFSKRTQMFGGLSSRFQSQITTKAFKALSSYQFHSQDRRLSPILACATYCRVDGRLKNL
jgi:hypothetical protein